MLLVAGSAAKSMEADEAPPGGSIHVSHSYSAARRLARAGGRCPGRRAAAGHLSLISRANVVTRVILQAAQAAG